MGFAVVYFAGRVLRHIGGILLLCWRRMAWAALITGGVGLIVAEAGGSSVTHQIPAPIPAQIAAALFAIALGYGAALTALLAEIMVGAVETIRLLEGEAGAGSRAAAVIAERADGELSGFVGWIDAAAVALIASLRGRRRSSTRHAITPQSAREQEPPYTPSHSAHPDSPRKGQRMPMPAAQRSPLEFQRAAKAGGKNPQAQGEIVTLNLETLADIAATEEFINTAPRPAVNARPVSAHQLPRIAWAYDQRELRHGDDDDLPLPAPLVAPLESQAPPTTPEDHQS